MIKWKRIYNGYYKASIPTILEWDEEDLFPVEYSIRFMPEWRGNQKWALTAEVKIQDYTRELIKLSDSIGSSYKEMKEAAIDAVTRGFKYGLFGWHLR